jgi:hypothetical protein
MSSKPTDTTGIRGPHFLGELPETESQFHAARAAGKLREACNELAEKIEHANFSGSAAAQTLEQLAAWDQQVFRLAAQAAALEQDGGAAPRELADLAVRDWRRLARSLALADCCSSCDELLRQYL